MKIESSTDFPISPLNPLIVTRIVDNRIFQRAYTLITKDEFESFIEENIQFKDDRTLIGSWCGEWKTNVFQLDFEITIQKVIEYGRKKFKTFKY
ncbi:MAG: hypothetical protein FWC41_12405 [Firmicutes bacterium]|nr:hypothetical protein [Bacillota bacterium]